MKTMYWSRRPVTLNRIVKYPSRLCKRIMLRYILSPKQVISLRFKQVFGRPMNWDDPQDLNEKINWLKIYSDTSLWPIVADKYRVREYVTEKGLGDILVPLLAKWDNVDEISFKNLDTPFILKTNNGSGDSIAVQSKDCIEIYEVQKIYKRLFKHKYGELIGEFHYSKIKPCIIAERLLDHTKQDFPSSSLIDYKVFCTNGTPCFIWVCYDRTPHVVKVGCYDTSWVYHKEWSKFDSHFDEGQIIPKPILLPQMLDAASDLSSGFPFSRVDFYIVNSALYFGEITLTPCGGYMGYFTSSFLRKIGETLNLPR